MRPSTKDKTAGTEGKKDSQRGRAASVGVWAAGVALLPSLVLCLSFYQERVRPPVPGGWYVPAAQAATVYPVTEERAVAVVAVINPYRLKFQPVDRNNRLIGTAFTHDICRDYAPPGEDGAVGTIYERLIHTDEPGCWSLNPDKHCGFYKRRDAQDRPVMVRKD